MRVELSALFGLNSDPDVVADVHIGDGIHLQSLHLGDWLSKFCKELKDEDETQLQRIIFRQQLEWHVYTHRFYLSLNELNTLNDPQMIVARQLLMRAIVLSRIIKPTPIPLHTTMVKSIYPDFGERYYSTEINIGFYGTAYSRENARDITITN